MLFREGGVGKRFIVCGSFSFLLQLLQVAFSYNCRGRDFLRSELENHMSWLFTPGHPKLFKAQALVFLTPFFASLVMLKQHPQLRAGHGEAAVHTAVCLGCGFPPSTSVE